MLKCYYMELDSVCTEEQLAILYNSLVPDRKNRVDSLKNEESKKKQILTSAFLQYILSKELSVPAKDIEFSYNSQGKPSVKMSDVHFNMSHSGRYVMLALSDHQVGVDIERRRNDRMGVAKRFFCKEEYEDIINAGDKERMEDRFLEYWTLKEAYVKYLGKGLSVPFNSFRIVRACPDYRIEACVNDGSGLYGIKDTVLLKSFVLDSEYRYSVCCEMVTESEQRQTHGDDSQHEKTCSDIDFYGGLNPKMIAICEVLGNRQHLFV